MDEEWRVKLHHRKQIMGSTYFRKVNLNVLEISVARNNLVLCLPQKRVVHPITMLENRVDDIPRVSELENNILIAEFFKT